MNGAGAGLSLARCSRASARRRTSEGWKGAWDPRLQPAGASDVSNVPRLLTLIREVPEKAGALPLLGPSNSSSAEGAVGTHFPGPFL